MEKRQLEQSKQSLINQMKGAVRIANKACRACDSRIEQRSIVIAILAASLMARSVENNKELTTILSEIGKD